MGNELCFATSENRVKWSASLIVDLAKSRSLLERVLPPLVIAFKLA